METDGDASIRATVVGQVAGILCARAPGHPLRVAVDGITSAGKTTFANEVAAAGGAGGRPTARVSMDGYHHRRARRHRQGRLSADGYYEDAYDLEAAARELLQPLGPDGIGPGGIGPGGIGPGGTLRYRDRIIDLATDEPADSWAQATPETVLVVDGSFLQREELRDHWDEGSTSRSPSTSHWLAASPAMPTRSAGGLALPKPSRSATTRRATATWPKSIRATGPASSSTTTTWPGPGYFSDPGG